MLKRVAQACLLVLVTAANPAAAAHANSSDGPDNLKLPRKNAELWNEAGQKVGRHYAGPTWEGNDGSKVLGEVVERANAPDADAIPWLLLKATSSEGAGAFSTVTYVQRLETVGGVAPTEGCSEPTAGVEQAVPYRATYAFAYGTTP
jgi:hypothetical protein